MDFVKMYNKSKEVITDTVSISQNLSEIDLYKRYRYKRFINEGAMKSIYSCHDQSTARQVAYAVPKNNKEEVVESFLREAKITASLQHPNIIPVYDIGVDDDQSFFTMKLVDGQSLADVIKDPIKSLDTHYLLTVFLKVCDAVSYAHSNGIVHLDLKPENIQISAHGEVLICDWGLAKVVDLFKDESNPLLDNEAFYKADQLQHTLYGYIKGTPGFLSPEQAKGNKAEKSYSSDIYSLGAILYNILTKKIPIQSPSLDRVLEKND